MTIAMFVVDVPASSNCGLICWPTWLRASGIKDEVGSGSLESCSPRARLGGANQMQHAVGRGRLGLAVRSLTTTSITVSGPSRPAIRRKL